MSKRLPVKLLLSFCFYFIVSHAQAQPTIAYDTVITGLFAPVDVVNAGDGKNRLFIVQQNGIIRVWNGTALVPAPFLDVSSIIIYDGNERGLLSMAFHPEFETNGYFFIYYNNTAGAIELARYKVSADENVADAGSRAVLLTIPKPFTNHNGGDLNFGPDGMLYFATGDGGSANDPFNNAQTGTSLQGKMIRINVNDFTRTDSLYTIPANNPYVGDAAVDDRIWALGLRNPYRWSFDRQTGDMWIGDVGQGAKEEVNFRPAGATGHVNYGWRCYEGSIPTPGIPACASVPADYVPPVFDYDNPASGGSSVTGGFVYRGPDYPTLVGYYIAADVYSGTVYLLRPNGSGGWISSQQAMAQNFIVGFGEDEAGRLYAAGLNSGNVLRIEVPVVPLPVTLSHFSVQHYSSHNTVQWMTTYEQSTARFYIEYSKDNNAFERAGQITASRNSSGSSYSFNHNILMTAPLYYCLAIEDDNGVVKYSTAVKVLGGRNSGIKVYPTTVRNNILNLSLPQPVATLQLINGDGRVSFQKSMKGIMGATTVTLPQLAKGVYLVQIIGVDGVHKEKIVIQ